MRYSSDLGLFLFDLWTNSKYNKCPTKAQLITEVCYRAGYSPEQRKKLLREVLNLFKTKSESDK